MKTSFWENWTAEESCKTRINKISKQGGQQNQSFVISGRGGFTAHATNSQTMKSICSFWNVTLHLTGIVSSVFLDVVLSEHHYSFRLYIRTVILFHFQAHLFAWHFLAQMSNASSWLQLYFCNSQVTDRCRCSFTLWRLKRNFKGSKNLHLMVMQNIFAGSQMIILIGS